MRRLKTLANTVEERTILMITISKRLNKIALPALAVLVVTGVYKAQFFLASPNTVPNSNYSMILVVKMAVVASMIVLFGIHVEISSTSKEQLLANDNSDSKVTKLRTKII